MIGTMCVPPSLIIHPAIVARPSGTPRRSSCFSCRYSGTPSTNFVVAMCANSAGVARLLGSNFRGTGAIATPVWQQGQAYLGRMLRITRTSAGLKSSCSEISSPMRSSAVPSVAQIFSSGGRSCTTSTRGSSVPSFLRARNGGGILRLRLVQERSGWLDEIFRV